MKTKVKAHTISITLSKKRDAKIVRLLVKHLNRAAGGLRSARTKRSSHAG